jgi:hypothetical protein
MPHKTLKCQRAATSQPPKTFQLEDQRDQLECDISVHGLTCPSATASYVHANPAKYGTTTEGMCCHSTLELQLGQLKGLVYAQKFQLSVHLKQLKSDISQYGAA